MQEKSRTFQDKVHVFREFAQEGDLADLEAFAGGEGRLANNTENGVVTCDAGGRHVENAAGKQGRLPLRMREELREPRKPRHYRKGQRRVDRQTDFS